MRLTGGKIGRLNTQGIIYMRDRKDYKYMTHGAYGKGYGFNGFGQTDENIGRTPNTYIYIVSAISPVALYVLFVNGHTNARDYPMQ